MEKERVTAKELAERFNVSVRTIYRDVDDLSCSGIPVYTIQGVNGGISILDNYTMNKTMLSDTDKNNILIALQSLKSTKFPDVDIILDKLEGIFRNNASDWISMDFSPWGSNPNVNNKFNDIRGAILDSKVINIEYINSQNIKSIRTIEPLHLRFKYQAWYLYSWCRKRQEYRSFRLSRIKKVEITDEIFDRFSKRVTDNSDDLSDGKKIVSCVLRFKEEALYRIYDDYDDDMIKDNKDGTYTLTVDLPEDEWVYGYILSFGTNVEVIKPESIRKIICEKSREISKLYIDI
jgi:predicted DNA-binding transcriptional regulator YafY